MKTGKAIGLAFLALLLTGGAVAGGIAISKHINSGDALPWASSSAQINSGGDQEKTENPLNQIDVEKTTVTF